MPIQVVVDDFKMQDWKITEFAFLSHALMIDRKTIQNGEIDRAVATTRRQRS